MLKKPSCVGKAWLTEVTQDKMVARAGEMLRLRTLAALAEGPGPILCICMKAHNSDCCPRGSGPS